jgi:hypothetical protein
MSEVISLVATAFVVGVALPAGAKLIHSVMNRLSSETSIRTGARPYQLDTAFSGDKIQSVASIRSAVTPITFAAENADTSAAVKETYLRELASRPYLSSDSKKLAQQITAFRSASGRKNIEAARRDLEELVESDHNKLFGAGLSDACQRAAIKTGFGKIESLTSPIGSSIRRFSATDPQGRTIVTEIDVAKDRPVRIDSEILGVRDNSCHEILNEFHRALESEGVEIQGTPRRRKTGGMCALPVAKIFRSKERGVSAEGSEVQFNPGSEPVSTVSKRSTNNQRIRSRVATQVASKSK